MTISEVSDSAHSTITVLPVEDHPIVREAVCRFINAQPDMRVVASAASVAEATPLCRLHHPDVAVIGLPLVPMQSGENGEGADRALENARIVVLVNCQGELDLCRLLEAGRMSYLFMDVLSPNLIRTVRETHGRQYASLELPPRQRPRSDPPPLTRRECEVLEFMATGMRNKEIASALHISEETAHGYIKSIFIKFGVSDRTTAVMYALRRGIIHLGICCFAAG